ncbi:MAG: ATP-binding cassette domain-containing protein, partial [Paracoccaceae bacterium]
MTGAVLKVENLCKSFGALPVSDAVDLEVKSGEIHAIIGPNGAGKSTLIGQIAGGLSPDTGSIFLNGQDITGLKMAHRAQLGLGRTFQISSLAMEMSVLENTILGAIGQRQDAHRFWS